MATTPEPKKKRAAAFKRPAAKKAAPAKKPAPARKTAAAKKPAAPEPKAKPRKAAKPKEAAPVVENLHALQKAMTPKGQEKPADALEPMGEAMAKLTEKQRTFVREYLVDLNATQAAIRAGYSEKTAHAIGHENLRKPEVAAAVKEEQGARLKRLQIDGDDVVRHWHQQLFADPNELTQHRRVCCRHCWGDGFNYQYTPGEYKAAKARHDFERTKIKAMSKTGEDIGEFPVVEGDWFDKRREPHPDCPECFGEGEPEVFFADSRKLSPAGRALYAGVKVGKEGIEVLMHNQQNAGQMLGRNLGLFNDKLEINATVSQATTEELDRFYEEERAKSKAAEEQVRGRGDRIRASMPKT